MSPGRSFPEVCAELDRRRFVTMGLERIVALLAAMGHPEDGMRVVQVVGTNGKGTTTVALASALEAAGVPVGAYLSPHLISYTERVRLGERFVTEGEFAAGMDAALTTADRAGIGASQFELLTAGALGIFREWGVRWAVLEAGLGARLDATTAARPEAVVLTNVGPDHTEYLGETIPEITREKLGGLPEGGTLYLGTDDPEVVEVVEGVARARGVRVVGPPTTGGLPEGLPPYLRRNVGLGLLAAEGLGGVGLGPEERARVARVTLRALPGRFGEYRVRGVPVVVDGGHNEPGIRASLEAVRARYGGRPLAVVFGALREKDIRSMLSALRQEADVLVLTRPEEGRAADPERVAREHDPRGRDGRRARVVDGAADAVLHAVESLRGRDGVVLITGSLYTGAAALAGLGVAREA